MKKDIDTKTLWSEYSIRSKSAKKNGFNSQKIMLTRYFLRIKNRFSPIFRANRIFAPQNIIVGKILLFISISLVIIACGRTIVDDPTIVLSPPTITAITSTTSGRVKIDWHYSPSQEPLIKGFLIERAENNGRFKLVSSNLAINQRSLDLAEAFKNGQVSFKVLSIGEKDTTASNMVSYFAPNVASSTLCNALYANLVETNNKASVYLTWKSESNSVNYKGNYLVQRAVLHETTFQTIATTPNAYYLDDKILTKETYKYRVLLASDNCLSNEITLTIDLNAIGLCAKLLKLTPINDNSKKAIILNWEAQLSDFSSFSVKRATTINGPFETLLPTNIRTTVFEDKSDLKFNTSYFYKISTQISSQPPNSCESNIVEIKNN